MINKWGYLLPPALLSIVLGVVISTMPVISEGLEYLFLLPISYGIAIIVFAELFLNWKENIGMTILFCSSVLRYIISPFLMTLTRHSVSYIYTNSHSYRMAIFVMIYELFATLLIASFVRKKHLRKSSRIIKKDSIRRGDFKVTWLGALLTVLIILMLIRRGNLGNVFSHFSVFTRYSEDKSDVYTYDRTFVYILKSFFFIAIASYMKKLKERIPSFQSLFLLIASIAALLNVVFYDHTSRSILVEFIVSSVAVLVFCFPQKKKLLVAAFSIAGFILVSSVFLAGTLQTTWGAIGSSGNIIERISEMSELYGNGVSTVAHAIDTYAAAHKMLGISSLIGGFLRALGFITFPGFRSIYYAFSNTPTAASLFMSSLAGKGFILPPFGLALYYGDIVFAIPISLLNMYICFSALYWVERKRIYAENDAGILYIVTYAEIICGMSFFVNNITIMIQGLTELPLLLFIFFEINRLGNRIIIKKHK